MGKEGKEIVWEGEEKKMQEGIHCTAESSGQRILMVVLLELKALNMSCKS